MRRACLLLAALLLAGCMPLAKPQKGGGQVTQFGGATAPTIVTTTAPENPQTPSTTTVEKITERVYEEPLSPEAQPATLAAGPQDSADHHRTVATTIAPPAAGENTSPPRKQPLERVNPPSPPRIRLVRELVHEKATTQLGTAQKDTVRELGVRLASMRGVMWVGVLLLVGGPIVGLKMGWFTNGCIAGGVGLLLIILSQVLPGNEAWFGLFGLLLIPAVSFIYYRARKDERDEA